ncbi:MAG: DUF1963 domain-containing protein [Bacteroidaceae bacterium]|nr:DUF1963 domain-containing protein [Bacteroidaceae bacterium]
MHIKIDNTRPASDDRFGQSKWWGSPDIPVGVDFPQYIDSEGEEWPMQFICQINLADLAEYDTKLPKEGLLLFFAHIDYFLGYDDPEVPGEGVWDSCETKVLYVSPDDFDTLQQRILVDEDENPLYIPCRELNFEVSPEDASDCHNKLLGSPDFMPWEDWDAPCEGWQVLLQVDSQEDDDCTLRFMDEGVMYFLINPTDLANAQFNNVRGAMVSM